MNFLHPALAAAGLACIAIPIIIHLLMHRRRKPVMWGAMRFLLEAYRRQRRRLMLEKWLLLAVRCLLIALIGLAIGRPLVGALAGSGSGGRTVYLLIDNGLASGVTAEGVSDATALRRHKQAAFAVIEALSDAPGDADRVAVIAMAGPASGIVVPPAADLGAVRSLIEAIEPAESRTDLPGAMALAAGALGDESGSRGSGGLVRVAGASFVVVLSDFLEGSADLAAALPVLPKGTRLIASEPAERGPSGGNIGIVSVEPLRSIVLAGEGAGGGALSGLQARVILRRSGDAVRSAGVSTIRAAAAMGRVGGSLASPVAAGESVVRWSAGEEQLSAIVRLEPTGPSTGSGPGEARAAILRVRIDADALEADNVWVRPVEIRESLRVGVVSLTRFASERADRLDAGSWARIALAPGSAAGAARLPNEIEVVEIEPAALDAARIAGLDALVLARPDLLAPASWARLRLFVDGGGLLIAMPPSSVTVHLWPDAMVREFGLPWNLARESKSAPADASGTVAGWSVAAAVGGAGGSGSGEGGGGGVTGVLGALAGELPELLTPVHVFRSLPMEGDVTTGDTPLVLADGTPLIWIGAPRAEASAEVTGPPRGLVVYLSTALDLEWTDLPTKPLVVALMQELVRQGVGAARGSWWAVAGSMPAAPPRSAELVLAGGRTGEGDPERIQERVVVSESGRAAVPLRRAGVWRAVDERGVDRGLIAVNADPAGARVGAIASEAISSALVAAAGVPEDGSATSGERVAWLPRVADDAGSMMSGPVRAAASGIFGGGEQGSPYSLPLLVAAVVMAVFEAALARRASHAYSGPSAVTAIAAGGTAA